MGIFSNLFARKQAKPGANTTRALLTSWIPTWFRGDYTLYNSELIFSAVSRISNSLSAMPIQLYQGSTPKYNDLNDLLSFEPNPNMTSAQFIKTFEACRDTYGNGYALKGYDENGSLSRLDILDPARVTPVLDERSKELWYKIQPETGTEYYIHNYYVLHVPFISTNGHKGVNPISVLFNTLSYSDEITKFNSSQLQKGINAQIVLEAPASLGEQQRKDTINDFMNTYKETSGNILLLESGVKANTLNLSPIDTKILEVEKITRSKVAMVYNIPPHLLGDYSDASFSSQEQQMLEYLMLTMLPIVTAYEQEFNRKLLSREDRKKGYSFKMNMDSILRADAATQAEVNYKAVRSAWKTPDEIRKTYNLPPLPGGIGKKAVISRDLIPLDTTVNNTELLLSGKSNAGSSAAQSPDPGGE